MGSGAREIFERLAKRSDDSRLRGVKGSYRFDVEGVGSCRVAVADGKLDVKESTAEADCVIACDDADFVRIALGQQNLLTAMMQGRVRIDGDLSLALKLHGLMPAPARAPHPQQPGKGAP